MIFARVRRHDTEAIEAELDEDFSEEFEIDEAGQPSERGMEELVEWMEEDLQVRRIEASEEIESIEAIPEIRTD
ncbi:MAG: hypothetical protein VB997_04245 [Opitutales bacterium]